MAQTSSLGAGVSGNGSGSSAVAEVLQSGGEIMRAEIDQLANTKPKEALTAALEELRRTQLMFGKLKLSVTTDLGTLPTTLAVKFTDVERSLALETQTDPLKIDKAIEDSGDIGAAIEKSAQELVTQKQAYAEDLALIEMRVKALEGHDRATVDFVKDKIDAIKRDVEAIKVQAARHEYTEAKGKFPALAQKCLETEAVADKHGKYNALLTDREDRVGALTDSPKPDVQKMVTATRDKLAKAKDHGIKKEFDQALKLLDEIPQDCQNVAWTLKQSAAYDTALSAKTTSIANAKLWTSVNEVGPYMPAVELLFDTAKYDQTQDYVKSISILDRVSAKLGELWKIIGAFKDFRTEYNNAKTKITELENHTGKPGVLEPIARMKSDLTFAEQKRDTHEYLAAKNVCLAIIKRGDEAEKTAEEYEAYIERREEVTDERATFTGGKSAWVAGLLAEADKLLLAAAAQATAKDYVAGETQLDDAMNRCELARGVLDSQEAIDEAASDIEPEIDDIDTDFDTAYDSFTQFKDQVASYDSSATFTNEINAAVTKADNARVEATKPTPDFDGAKQLLRGAIRDCTNVMFWVNELKVYEALRTPIVDRVTALKTPAARGVALQDGIQGVAAKLTDAKTQADRRNYPAAEPFLTEADKLLAELNKLAEFYDDFMALRDPGVKNAVAAVNTVTGKTALDVEVTKLTEDLTKADDLKTQKKFKDAWEALQKVKTDADALKTKLDYYVKAKSEEKKRVTNKIGAIKDKPLVDAEYQRVVALQVKLKRMFDERQFKEAEAMTDTISWVIRYATETLKRYDAYVIERDKAQDAINKLKAVACDAIKDDIKTMENFFGKAQTFAADGNYENALPHLVTVLQGCVKPTELGKAFALYKPSLTIAEEAVAALGKDFPKSEAVDLQRDTLTRQLIDAKKLAAQKSFDDAKKATDAVALACAEVRKSAEAQGEFDEALTTAASGPQDTVAGLDAEILKVKTLAGKLTARNMGAVLKDDLAGINKLLETAETERTSNNAAQARTALTSAAEACAMANAKADQYVQVDLSLKASTTQVETVRNKYAVPPLITLKLADLDKYLLLARNDADNGFFSSALNTVQSTKTELAEMERIGAAHALYVAERKKLDPRIETLAKSKARYMIAKELGEARAYVAEAETKVEARDYKEAMKMLVAATDICDNTTLQADMHEEKEPTKEALETILKKPGGDKQLDAIIKTLDPKSQRKVCKLALELRFNVKLELFSDTAGATADIDMDKQGPDIVRFYEIMQALPKAHTKENPSLDKIQRLGEDVGTSSFNKGTRVSKLRVGRATDKTEEIIGQEWQLGDIDDDAKPPPGDPPSTFSWTTLHEIGHAVDDRLGFMKSRGSGSAFGAWKEYGADTSEVAAAAFGKFGFPKAYLEAYLAGEKPPVPEPPSGADAAEWERKRIEAETWCDAIRNDKDIYYSASATARLQIAGRVYQEAYAGKWVSYDFAARTKGVVGYQFRAPGEWFAEIYAAYHTGKMNANHPARSWLSQLK